MSQDLQQTVDALLARVACLEDEREIGRVLARYGFAVDVGDADAAAGLYTEDAVIDLGPSSEFSGRAGARQLVLDARHQAILGRCAHTVGPFAIDWLGPDRARATGYMRVYVTDEASGEARLTRLSYTAYELVREGVTWCIASRVARVVGSEGAARLLEPGLREGAAL